MDARKLFRSFIKGREHLLQIPPPDHSRAPRVRIDAAHHITFVSDEETTTRPMKVANISTSGIALHETAQARQARGWLTIGKETWFTRLDKVHCTEGVTGYRYCDPHGRLVDAIRDHLQAEIDALEAVELHPDTPPSGKETAKFFHGRNGSELYYSVSRDAVVRFHLLVSGLYCDGGMNCPTNYGIVDDWQPGQPIPEKVDHADDFTVEQKSVFHRFLMNLSSLPPEHRRLIIKMID